MKHGKRKKREKQKAKVRRKQPKDDLKEWREKIEVLKAEPMGLLTYKEATEICRQQLLRSFNISARVAQLEEQQPSKLLVASSSLAASTNTKEPKDGTH